ncbi:MAG TPA: DMT family transporter [Galbitalea sp.]|jgi:drug/metabolite transporter (DMT)-like permease|nr:DMT family transporter [Galbitalea sp.]
MIAVVALGLGAAIVYGVSDFFGAFAARRIHLITATLFNYAVATVSILVALLIVGGVWSIAAIEAGVACGVLAVFGLLAFYGVLAIGPMSLLSPLIALIGSIVPVVAAVVTGQALTPFAWVAIAIGIVALILLAPRREPGHQHITPRAALLAVASGLLLGVSLIALDFAPHNSGVVPSVLEIVAGLVVLAIAWLVLRFIPGRNTTLAFLQPGPDAVADLSAPRAWLAAAVSGVLVGVADAFIVLDLHVGNLAIVSVLVALYPVLTVILAATVLKERMTKLQFVAVGLVVVASLMFSATG